MGASHFVPLGNQETLELYADVNTQKKAFPKWFVESFKASVEIRYWPRTFFKNPIGLDSFALPNFSMQVSAKEGALMEVLALVPKRLSYAHAYLLFQGQETLRPSLVIASH
jgi:hypothetical protein